MFETPIPSYLWYAVGAFVVAAVGIAVWTLRTHTRRWWQGPYADPDDVQRDRNRRVWFKSIGRRDWQ